ncbi:TonB-dependent receptor [Sphingosinicella sp. LHD-64]|uniref:TonB-dependent receptor plug domain-containing protein n=1 Tax=Sphingosinicella sp. LHD-64 TaxID=3072139 RepID=UPI00280DC52C|nr:TonB-dependent receptor [Sphingosinicella sp. LHD-64]MDQ8754825.1 TonB-dependent receptor [Sphingosinicella sp. LHD-64]
MPAFLLLLSAAVVQPGSEIIVTAARAPRAADELPASSTLFDEATLDALSLPAASDVLRLSPGLSVAATGPRGTQTQVRIRGAEANHTLLFVDGIRFNDPASGNEPRFELLTTDALSRIEVVRGPQSALWGSEALGGVIAASTIGGTGSTGFLGDAEYGSLDSARLFGRYAVRAGDVRLSASGGWQRSDGIDSFGSGGERDGFDNVTASVQAVYRSGPIEGGVVGHWIEGTSEFDGTDPVTFRRADTLDETENRIGAVRGWLSWEEDGWALSGEASYLDSANRNRLGDDPLNSTFGDRLTLGAQVSRRFGSHQLIAAIDHNQEDFRARDTAFFGGTDQDRSRDMTAVVGEWRADWTPWLATDVALRHDDFSAFDDATTFRGSVLIRPVEGLTLHAAYGEGIAQPTFFDLYGFFPGSFVGNPDLKPESSRGWEAGVRWANDRLGIGVTGFTQRLRNEIVDTFDPVTFLSSTENADGKSRRDGFEVEASYRHADWLNLTANYTFLDADEQRTAGVDLVREVRRPRHTANLIAFGAADRFNWGASIAYVGKRRDTDFDVFPSPVVTLDDYALASLRIGYRILPQLELYARMENAFDADYQDVIGYNTPGRTVYAGLRVALGR